MKTILKKLHTLWVKILTVIGDIKVYPYPCFLHYNPNEYEYNVLGSDIRELSNLIKPGDIILRGYNHYLDGYLIPGEYSHSGVCVSDTNIIHAVAEGVKEIDIIDFCQCDRVLILRPKDPYFVEEICERAKSYLGTEYDFLFNSVDSSAFYCHELTATCYEGYMTFNKVDSKIFGVDLGGKYLAESFINSEELETIFEKNDK